MFRCALVLLSTAAAVSQPAMAQEITSMEPASTQRLDGGLELAAGYTDNVFATRNEAVDDLLLVARPSLSLNLGSKTKRLTIRGSGEIGRFQDYSTEDYNDWLLGADGRLQAARGVALIGGAEHQWAHENRSSPDVENGIEPTRYRRGQGFAGVLMDRDGLRGRLAGTLTRLDFRDVPGASSVINNDDRDRFEGEVGALFGVQVAPATELFVQGAYDRRDYDDRADDAGFRRDSTGWGAALGLRRTFSPQLAVELLVGGLHRDYRDPSLEDVRTVDYGALVEWTGPTGLQATLRVDRSAEETTLPDASSYLLTVANLAMQMSAARRIDAGASLSGSSYDYQGGGRSEFVLGADLWTRYWLHPRLYLGLDYRFGQRDSRAAGFDYDENRIMVQVGARLRPRSGVGSAPLSITGRQPAGAYAGLLLSHGTIVTALDGPRGRGSNTADFGDSGLGFGAVAGYGIASGGLYLGLEAEAALGGPDWFHRADRVFSVERKGGIGLAGRIGHLTPASDLIFGRVGVSRARFRTDYRHSDYVYGRSENRIGLGVGVGLEAGAGGRTFVRTEYVLTSYRNVDIPTGSGAFDNFASSEAQFRIGAGARLGAAERKTQASQAARFAGPYAGIQVGHGSLTSRNLGTRSGETDVDIQRSSHGPLLGLIAGTGLSRGAAYAGAELEAELAYIDWNIERDPNGRIYSARQRYSFGGALRAGFQISRSALLYGWAGIVRTRFDIPYATSGTSVLSEETKTGARFGGGLEIATSGSLNIRLEHVVTSYDRYDVAYGNNSDSFKHKIVLTRMGGIFCF